MHYLYRTSTYSSVRRSNSVSGYQSQLRSMLQENVSWNTYIVNSPSINSYHQCPGKQWYLRLEMLYHLTWTWYTCRTRCLQQHFMCHPSRCLGSQTDNAAKTHLHVYLLYVAHTHTDMMLQCIHLSLQSLSSQASQADSELGLKMA